jgi:hypothetical protein
MNKKSHDNLAEVIARMDDPKRAADGLKSDRNRIAKMLREARIRVKANKAANDGAYVAYVAKPLGPDPRD